MGRAQQLMTGGAGLLLPLLLLACGPSASADDTPTCESPNLLCTAGCIDISADNANCGGCDIVCDTAALYDCMNNICVPPACDPDETRSCYTGPDITEGVGPCQPGTQICSDRGRWESCQGEVLPEYEDCTNGIDDNCNGEVDEDRDDDNDGFRTCEGDCCDTAGPECDDPELVNPGAFEVAGNDVDDDCDGTVDNVLATCDASLASDSSDPLDYAAAIDLCQTSIESGNQADLRWGVISAELVLADGTGTPASVSRSIRAGFGDNVVPQFGSSMVVLATGTAASAGQTNPAHAAFQVGTDNGTSSAVPADWLAANNGILPNAPGCPAATSTTASDPVMLKLRIRAPTNAQSFSMDINFFSSEYPEWVCSRFNDFFVVLLDSAFTGTPANPADKNLAIYTAPDMSQYPVGVNLAFGDTGLFRMCKNGSTGCTSSAVSGETTTCQGLAELTGTGFDVVNPPSAPGAPGKCGQNNLAGGGTSWLQTSGNVVPGEVFELRIAVWDTSDSIYDTVVLIDNFTWSVNASEPGTDIIVD